MQLKTQTHANPMACALLNRDLESVQSMPLASLVATASGRPPPQGLVSKCKLHCVGSESVSVECDCRVFSDGKSVPLLFCHLALMDVRGLDGSSQRRQPSVGLATAGQTSLAEKSRFGTLAACNTLAWEDLQSFSQSPAESSQPAHPAAL